MKALITGEHVTAQVARYALQRCGWTPILKLAGVEHYIKDNKHCWIRYDGDEPNKVSLNSWGYINFILLDSEEIIAL